MCHPAQIWRRVARVFGGAPRPHETVRLPWGMPLTIRPGEDIGRQIWAMGVFDLCVTEALWRLVDPGELTIDVGGNIGYMSSILSVRAGRRGRVIAFEPHPDVFKDFAANAAGWQQARGWTNVEARQLALGNHSGEARLAVPDRFEENRGLARIQSDTTGNHAPTIPIAMTTLTKELAAGDRIGVLKIDVEGHELPVLEGAEALLRERRVREIIFEERGDFPSPVAQFLQRRGFEIFALRPRLSGPRLEPPDRPVSPLRQWETPSFLATMDSKRARDRFAPRGWQSLRG